MSDDEQWSDRRLKHLEFIQTAINRQSHNSFLLKGWSLTITVALFGLAAGNLNWRFGLIGLLPALAFWILDAYFLRQERLFRHLYDDARVGSAELFSMNTERYRPSNSWARAFFSTTLALFYGLLLTVGVIIAVWTAATR